MSDCIYQQRIVGSEIDHPSITCLTFPITFVSNPSDDDVVADAVVVVD